MKKYSDLFAYVFLTIIIVESNYPFYGFPVTKLLRKIVFHCYYLLLMEDSTYNDSDVCVAISEGDKEALSYLFTKYYDYLFNYGLKIVHHENEEEIVKDSIQEIFLSIWVNREKMEQIKHIRSYLFSALRLAIYHHLEKQKNRVKRELQYQDENRNTLFNIEEILIHFEIEKENETIVQDLIKKLSKRKKEAIYLKFFHGFNNEEIASIMRINIQSVYNLISESIVSMQLLIEK